MPPKKLVATTTTPSVVRHTPGPWNGKPQAERDPVEVYCRIRPLKSMTDLLCVKICQENVIRLVAPSSLRQDMCFTFKKVFPEDCEQKDVFSTVSLPLIQDLIDGKSGLLFTYGVTSSGKTHTIAGSPTNCGILPRSLDLLFNSIKNNQARKYVFKPDGQNSFNIQSPADALLELQNDRITNKTQSISRNPRKRRQDANDLKGWIEREKDMSFSQLKNNQNLFTVFISYVEIYNNYIYDLLDDSTIDQIRVERKQPPSKYLRDDGKKRTFVQGASELEATTADDAFEIFLKGLKRRKIAHTALNAESSRSHSVFNIRVVQAPMDQNHEIQQSVRPYIVTSQLSLVDLAGSERTGRSGTTGDRLREAGNINNSLMSLRTCIDILRENQTNGTNKVVPYRDNKLTHLFKNYFEGEGKVKMIICVNPSSDEYEETVHVMKFAESTQEVQVTRALAPKTPGFYGDVDGYKNMNFANGINFGPIPTKTLEDPDDEKAIPDWIHFLNDRKVTREHMMDKLRSDQLSFRNRIITMEKDYIFLTQQNKTLKNDLEARQNQVREIQYDVENYGQVLSAEKRKVALLQKENDDLRGEVQTRDDALTQAAVEQERTRSMHMDFMRREQARIRSMYEREMEDKLASLRNEKCLNQEKMELVKNILCSDSRFMGEEFGAMVYPTSPRKRDQSNGSSLPNKTNLSTPAGSINPGVTTRSRAHHKVRPTQTSTPTQDPNGQDMGDQPIEYEPCNQPLINPRHRRSISQGGEKWLDHRPSALKTGTVLQPMIKNKKSFSNMKECTSAMFKNASNYALTHHTADEDGEVETRVFKGNVIPSITGGAHVIFNDVETLTQEDPMGQLSPGRKRGNSNHHHHAISESETATPSTVNSVNENPPPNVINKRSRR